MGMFKTFVKLVEEGNTNKIKLFLQDQSNINIREKNGFTPLAFAILFVGNFELVDILLTFGADPNCCVFDECVPILVCSFYDIRITRLLLSRGADPNFRDIHGSTPLMRCCGRYDLLELLFNFRANPYLRNIYGETIITTNRFDSKCLNLLESRMRNFNYLS